MQITFESVDELKVFCRTFRLEEQEMPEPPPPEKLIPSQTADKIPASQGEKRPAQSAKKTTVQTASMSMIDRLRAEIQAFADAGKPFTTNAICDAVLIQDPGLNRASVVTSISKLMTTQFADIPSSEEPGKGPRPMKMYHPA